MEQIMITYRMKIVSSVIAGISGMFLAAGCAEKKPAMVTIVEQRHPHRFDRVDLPEDYVQEGLRQMFGQLAKRYGEFDSEALIKDYSPLIQQGLRHNGICSIQRLNIQGNTVDVDIYFIGEPKPARLVLQTYLNGQLKPEVTLASNFTFHEGPTNP